jgi:hypothetical protein
MMTMNNGVQSQIDDVLDARAAVRQLRLEVTKRRQALAEVRDKLATASGRLEDLLTELEQKQGRLPFGDDAQAQDDAPSPAARPSNGRGRKRAAVAHAGQSSWKETR